MLSATSLPDYPSTHFNIYYFKSLEFINLQGTNFALMYVSRAIYSDEYRA